MKIVYFVNTTDNTKDILCGFCSEKYPDKEKLADIINEQIENAGFLDCYEDFEGVQEVGRALAYNGYAQYQEYEFGVENIVVV